MAERELPSRPNLEQYKKQAKELTRDFGSALPDAVRRARRHHPRISKLPNLDTPDHRFSLADAQVVIAREHGFESWPKFAKHIELLHVIESVATLTDPVPAFIEFACVPRYASHGSGTLDHAELILGRFPQVARHDIFTAAILADERAVANSLKDNPGSATVTGGPHHWSALTYLCFSRYLRLDAARAYAFVKTAKLLLEAGASANSGWFEIPDTANAPPIWESVIYGAAGIAGHPELTRLLLEYGADPNDGETPYHVPGGYDNTVLEILLESGKFNQESLSWALARKADWHDYDGLRLVLDHGGNPNLTLKSGGTALHHALRRDNWIKTIELLLDRGADPAITSARDDASAVTVAARRGRADVLSLFRQRGFTLDLAGVDRLIAACAQGDQSAVRSLRAQTPGLLADLLTQGGALLTQFAGNGNVEGLRLLLELGVDVQTLDKEGDPYFDIAKNSTALHVAAWRGRPLAVKELLSRGASVNALDGKGRTPLFLAVKACVDSYWMVRRSPESVEALLQAGASIAGIELPTGYSEIDTLLDPK